LSPHNTISGELAGCGSLSDGSTIIKTILPLGSISTRAIPTPAATTALTALVTSACRNVEGARAMGSHQIVEAVAGRPKRWGAVCRYLPHQEVGHGARVGWVKLVATIGRACLKYGLAGGNCANCGNLPAGLGLRSFRSFRSRE
jgi:hypothetical protein